MGRQLTDWICDHEGISYIPIRNLLTLYNNFFFCVSKRHLYLLKGSGRAFSSGGDMVTIYRLLQEGRHSIYLFYL